MRNPAIHHQYIQPAQLRVGLYIYLDLGWMDHPFSVSNFQVTDEAQIATLKSLGLKQIRFDPKRSSCAPLPLDNVLEFPRAQSPQVQSEVLLEVATLSPAQIKQNLLKQTLNESEQRFLKASQQVKNIQKLSADHPEKAFGAASELVRDLVNSILTESDIAIQAIHGQRSGDQHYQHELNTLVLSMMLAKNAGLSEEEAELLGTAAILHDIGKRQISDKILLKKDPLTVRETNIFQTHVVMGISMLKDLCVNKRLLTLIAQHHEHADGSGYPKGLKDAEIDPLSHMLIVVNTYDNLCNPTNPVNAKSPYEALGQMFAQMRRQFNEATLRRFIKCLGIYPPGSIIRLSDQRLATVISTNPQQPLRPFVQTIEVEPDVDGTVIDMRETLDINIVQCIKADQLPAIMQSVARRKQRMSYFLDKALPA